ncbi:MAG: pyridoxamine 5'-phosphate oxidase family protein, partial [Candidatus Promineifilaceae bacterium]
TYPQAPSMTEEGVVCFIGQMLFGRLGTINDDGTVHIAPVCYHYEDGQILIATQEPSRKIRNIKRSNKVTVLIDTTDLPFRGVLIYGTAELDYENMIAKRIAIFQRRPWAPSREDGEAYARKLSDKWPCIIIRITPERFTSYDYSLG